MPRDLFFVLIFLSSLTIAGSVVAQGAPRERAIALLEASLKSGSWTESSVLDLGQKLKEVLGAHSAGVKRLVVAPDEKPFDVEAARKRAESFLSDLSFKPLLEAETPGGWPTFTTVGEVELKNFPAYRMARVPMGETAVLSGNRAFWKLFQHIQTHNIAMTAPVQMDYPRGGEATMAFLYGDGVTGPEKVEDGVTVVDFEPGLYLSIGLRGSLRPASVVVARATLDAWLKEHDDYEALGGYRTLGWNSPMVPRDRTYHEVQIPVRRKLPLAPAAPSPKDPAR